MASHPASPQPNRRQWLRTLSACAASGIVAGTIPRALAIEPFARKEAHLKLSLAAYSFRDQLLPKAKGEPKMTLADFIDFAAGENLDAVELTSYYFPETSPAYLATLKGRAAKLGLDVSGSAVGNDFTTLDPAKLKVEIEKVKKWTEITAFLGGKALRIFSGALPKGDSVEKARARVVEAIQECCDHAAKFGVYMALENHGGLTAEADGLLALVQGVKHDWFGVNLDTGNFRTADPYGDLAKLAPYAVNVQVKTEIMSPTTKKLVPADLSRLIGLLKASHYRGYVALEYEAKEPAKEAVPIALAELKKLIAG